MTKEEKIKEAKVKCPDCGSEKLDIPQNIEKRGECFFIKGTNLQFHTLPDPAYVCLDCKREISVEEVMHSIGRT